MIPPLNPVSGSSNVAATGHDGKALYLRFHRPKGTVLYRYDGFPAKLHREMLKSDSLGAFFHRHVKNAYRGVKVEE